MTTDPLHDPAEVVADRMHCGRCGRMLVPIQYANGGVRWFHTLGTRPVYEDPDGRDWMIGHDADPLPGGPTDRRSGVLAFDESGTLSSDNLESVTESERRALWGDR